MKRYLIGVLSFVAIASWHSSADAGTMSLAGVTVTASPNPIEVTEGQGGEVSIFLLNRGTLGGPSNPGADISVVAIQYLSLTEIPPNGPDATDKPSNIDVAGVNSFTPPLLVAYNSPLITVGRLSFTSDKDGLEIPIDVGLWDAKVQLQYSYNNLSGAQTDGFASVDVQIQIDDVPEPSTLCLLGTGAVCSIGLVRRRRDGRTQSHRGHRRKRLLNIRHGNHDNILTIRDVIVGWTGILLLGQSRGGSN
jgi:hypothetical protein